MITETLLDRPIPAETLRETKLEQFRRAVVFDLGLDEYVKSLNEQEGNFFDEGSYTNFYANLNTITRIIRFSVFASYQDVLKYGSQENKNHATSVLSLISRYRVGQIDNIIVGGSASQAMSQINTLVANFCSVDYQNKFVSK